MEPISVLENRNEVPLAIKTAINSMLACVLFVSVSPPQEIVPDPFSAHFTTLSFQRQAKEVNIIMNSDAVSQFMALYQSDPDLQEKFAQAEAAYPGSLDIREAVVEEILLPLAKEAGFSFTVEDLRSYETAVYLDKHRDEEQDPDSPDDDTVFFLLDRGWTNDATAEFSKA